MLIYNQITISPPALKALSQVTCLQQRAGNTVEFLLFYATGLGSVFPGKQNIA